MSSPKIVETFRTRAILDGGVDTHVVLSVPSQGQLTTLIIKQVGGTAATIAANVYDRADAAGEADDSANPDDGVAAFADETHRVIDAQSGSSGLLKAYGLQGFYRNCDEKPEHSAWELGQLHLVVNASVDATYDICAVVVGIY